MRVPCWCERARVPVRVCVRECMFVHAWGPDSEREGRTPAAGLGEVWLPCTNLPHSSVIRPGVLLLLEMIMQSFQC